MPFDINEQVDRMLQAASRFEKIDQRFTAFKSALDRWFNAPYCPLKQVNIEGVGPRCVNVSFGSTKIALRLVLALPEDSVATGQMICIRAQPELGTTDPMIATFTFNALGITSLGNHPSGDPIDLESHAVEIVLHFLEIALRPIEVNNTSQRSN